MNSMTDRIAPRPEHLHQHGRWCLKKFLTSALPVLLWSLFALLALRFGLRQDIWVDETTQLSGMTLSPVETFKWLAGVDSARFGVPGDRMPPLSYLIDWGWSRLISPDPLGLRLFHAAIVLGAVAFLGRAVRRALGWPSAVAATLLLAISTKLVQAAVEIRAYPIFFALTCLLLSVFLRLVSRGGARKRWLLVAFGWLGVLAVYTHFFAAIAYMGLTAGLMWHFRKDRRLVYAVLGVGALVALSMAALAPLAIASTALYSTVEPSRTLVAYATYLVQLVIGSAEFVWPVSAIMCIAGIALLLFAAASTLTRRSPPSIGADADDVLRAVAVALITGIGATMLASAVVRNFNPLKISYSLWTLPLVVVLLAGGWSRLVGISAWDRIGRHVALGLVVVGTGIAASLMVIRPDLYIHGPRAFLLGEREAMGNVPIIYDQSELWGMAYYPLRFSGKGRFTQWHLTNSGDLSIVHVIDGPDQPAPLPFSIAMEHEKQLMVVILRPDGYSAVRRYFSGASTGIELGAVGQVLAHDPRWQLERVTEKPGYYSTRVWIWRRVASDNVVSLTNRCATSAGGSCELARLSGFPDRAILADN